MKLKTMLCKILGDKQGGLWRVVQIFRLNIEPVSVFNGSSKQRIVEYYGPIFLLWSEPVSAK